MAQDLHGRGYRVVGLSGALTPALVLDRLKELAPDPAAIEAKLVAAEYAGNYPAQLGLVIQEGLNRVPAVVILDNLEDNQGEAGSSSQEEISDADLRQCLEQLLGECRGKSVVVLTTRYPVRLPHKRSIGLTALAFTDYLKKTRRLPQLGQLDYETHERLYKVVGGHPLLLDLLDGAVQQQAALLAKLEEKSADELRQEWRVVEQASATAHRQILAKVFLEKILAHLSTAEQQALSAAAVYRVAIDNAGWAAALGEAVSGEVMVKLRQCSLLSSDSAQRKYVHRSVAAYLWTRLTPEQRQQLHQRAGEYHYARGKGKGHALEDLHEARHHFLQAQQWEQAADMVFIAEEFLRDRLGDYRQAEKLNRELLAYPISPENQAIAWHNVGMCRQRLGDVDSALDCYQRSLKLAAQIGNPGEIASSLHQIGMVYQARGELEPALDYYQRSLELFEQIGNPGLIATSLGAITLLYRQWGKPRQELGCIGRALLLLPRLPGPLGQKIARVFMQTWQSPPPAQHNEELVAAVGEEQSRLVLALVAMLEEADETCDRPVADFTTQLGQTVIPRRK